MREERVNKVAFIDTAASSLDNLMVFVSFSSFFSMLLTFAIILSI